MLGRAKIELFNRNFYKSFCVERSIKRVSHNKSFRKCCITYRVFDLLRVNCSRNLEATGANKV